MKLYHSLMRECTFCLVIIFLVLGTAAATTSPPVPDSKKENALRTRYYESMTLNLYSKEVVTALRLTPQQLISARKYMEGTSRFGTLLHMVEARERDKRKIFSHLSPDQINRYNELLLQAQGALTAFLIPKNREKLKFTENQEHQLDTLFLMYKSGFENLKQYESALMAPYSSKGEISKQLKPAADKMAESILTADQHLIWRSLQGPLIYPRPNAG